MFPSAFPRLRVALRPYRTALGLFAAYLALAGVVCLPGVDAVERALAERVRGALGTDVRGLMKAVSVVAGFKVMVCCVPLLAALHWRAGGPRLACFVLGVMGAELPLEGLSKLVSHRIRPDLTRLRSFDSFPSGHALAAAVLAGILLAIWLPRCRRRWQRALAVAPAVAWPVLVSAARVYLGRHYPTDVLGGVLLGAAWALFCRAHWLAPADKAQPATTGKGGESVPRAARGQAA